MSDSQFGFRKGSSTTDAVFVLNAIIQKILNEKGRFFCAFVGLKRAFDSVLTAYGLNFVILASTLKCPESSKIYTIRLKLV